SDNVVRQENIETASTVTSIIPASTVNSDHNSTVIITQNNQPEQISSELIRLDISNTLQKAKNLANNQDPVITPQAPPKKVIDVIMAEANQSQKDKPILPSKGADTATRSLSGNLQSQPEGLKRCISAQRVPEPCRSVEKLHEFLPHCEKIPGPSPHLQVTQWMASIYGKEEHDSFNNRMEENNPPPPKQVPKTAPIASRSNSYMKKKPQAQNKGKGNAPATKPYSQG
ncbi:hypothetical protein O181_071484, partial [Austropuccinia psidii MF-1]|nr:hypothetical protein [Austropuccinia psidii MF-1]